MNKTTEVLTLAKEILESEVEWCQGVLHRFETDEHGYVPEDAKVLSACAVGAVEIALGRILPYEIHGYAERRDVAVEAQRRMMEHIEKSYATVPSFNDDEYTTKEDVLLVFKKAIESE